MANIPSSRFGHLAIAYANLRGNRIGTLHSDVFAGITKLEILDLSNNNLAWLDAGALKPAAGSLIELHLESNRLNESLSEALAHLTRLERLNLARNNLSVLVDLRPLVRLTELNLARNQLTSVRVEPSLGLLPISVVDLNLEGNRFTHLTGRDLVGLTSLKFLNLANNRIVSICPKFEL